MKRFILVFGLLLVGLTAFADTSSDAFAAMEKATAECQEAWNNLLNCEMMSFEEFTAEYKKNHFALNNYDNEWSANLSRAFKEYMTEVEQTQKELWDIYYEKEAKEKEAEEAFQAEIDEHLKDGEALQIELKAKIDELSKDGNK